MDTTKSKRRLQNLSWLSSFVPKAPQEIPRNHAKLYIKGKRYRFFQCVCRCETFQSHMCSGCGTKLQQKVYGSFSRQALFVLYYLYVTSLHTLRRSMTCYMPLLELFCHWRKTCEIAAIVLLCSKAKPRLLKFYIGRNSWVAADRRLSVFEGMRNISIKVQQNIKPSST